MQQQLLQLDPALADRRRRVLRRARRLVAAAADRLEEAIDELGSIGIGDGDLIKVLWAAEAVLGPACEHLTERMDREARQRAREDGMREGAERVLRG